MYTYVLYSSELQLYYTQVMRHVQSISLLFYKEVQLQLERHSFRMLAAAAGFVAYSPRTLMLCMVRLFPPDSDAKMILYIYATLSSKHVQMDTNELIVLSTRWSDFVRQGQWLLPNLTLRWAHESVGNSCCISHNV